MSEDKEKIISEAVEKALQGDMDAINILKIVSQGLRRRLLLRRRSGHGKPRRLRQKSLKSVKPKSKKN